MMRPRLNETISLAFHRDLRVTIDHATDLGGRTVVLIEGPGISGRLLLDELLALNGIAQRHVQQGSQICWVKD